MHDRQMATPLNNSLLKGFEILGLFSANTAEISATLVVQRLGLNAATAHRFLTTLEAAGAIRATRRGHYALGPGIAALGKLARDANALAQVLAPVVEGLAHELGQSVMACQLTGQGPVCVAVANAGRGITVNISVGALLPAIPSAQGRIWLAEMTPAERAAKIRSLAWTGQAGAGAVPEDLEAVLDQVRAQGFAVNRGLNEPDIAAVSVPVRGADGRVDLTLSAFGMLSRFSDGVIETALQRLQGAARDLGDVI